jgi:hypothetical protein
MTLVAGKKATCGYEEAQKKVPVFRVRALNPSAKSDLTLQHITVTVTWGTNLMCQAFFRILESQPRFKNVGFAQGINQGIEVDVAESVPVDDFLVG